MGAGAVFIVNFVDVVAHVLVYSNASISSSDTDFVQTRSLRLTSPHPTLVCPAYSCSGADPKGDFPAYPCMEQAKEGGSTGECCTEHKYSWRSL